MNKKLLLNLYNITIDDSLKIYYNKIRFKHLKYVKIKQGGIDPWFEKETDDLCNV